MRYEILSEYEVRIILKLLYQELHNYDDMLRFRDNVSTKLIIYWRSCGAAFPIISMKLWHFKTVLSFRLFFF